MTDPQVTMTAAFIATDPTTAALVPVVETRTATGGVAYTDGAPRVPQTFKLSVLNFDQRPEVTGAGGVVRKVDYHLIGMPDMAIAVGDHWTDGDRRYEVVGFTDGHGYETKAFVTVTTPAAGKLG